MISNLHCKACEVPVLLSSHNYFGHKKLLSLQRPRKSTPTHPSMFGQGFKQCTKLLNSATIDPRTFKVVLHQVLLAPILRKDSTTKLNRCMSAFLLKKSHSPCSVENGSIQIISLDYFPRLILTGSLDLVHKCSRI